MQDKRLDIAINAIKQAGDYLKKQFYKRHEVSIKPDTTVLLGEDIKSEEILLSRISRAFPRHSFFTEETETKITSGNVWVLDPICGE